MARKKYALNNSYFKNHLPDMPHYPVEVVKYFKENNDLPFEYSGENWVYEMFCEFQKRGGVQLEQFLTPDKTAKRMFDLLRNYNGISTSSVLEIGCGTGQITKHLEVYQSVKAIDIDKDMIEICQTLYNADNIEFIKSDYKEFTGKFDYIICNPPYSDVPELLSCIDRNLADNGLAVVLLPAMTFKKERPKKLVELLSKFKVIQSEPMTEKFERTGVNAEISVIQRT